jgi:S-adenosylmethionine:tRNA ribosyltransferase-isomerase
VSAPFSFALPPELAASEPPERRGLARDGVRLLVLDRRSGRVEHTRFRHLGQYLRPGDLLVFNSSRTLPAVLDGRTAPAGRAVEVRLSEHLRDDTWLALLLCPGAEPSSCGFREGLRIEFDSGLAAVVEEQNRPIPRLWRIHFSACGTELVDLLYRIGRPVRYEHVSDTWGLDYYQTVYAREPGSAEMPSAGRAFTWKLLLDLQRRGVDSARVVLHTGLSSYLDDELDGKHPAAEEEYSIGETAAARINGARAAQRRVIAVGTTVVRALESAAAPDGSVRPGHRYTRLRVTADHVLRSVDGLLTGLHEPEASHLDLLAAFMPAERIHTAYEEAVRMRYLWHEFGDLNLIV